MCRMSHLQVLTLGCRSARLLFVAGIAPADRIGAPAPERMEDMAKVTVATADTMEALVTAAGTLPRTSQKGYVGSPTLPSGALTRYDDGMGTDPKDPKAQEAAYHAFARIGGKTSELAAALGFLAPRPFRKAANAWADANGLPRKVVRAPKVEVVDAS
jgi:hypothetical protein